jgi:DNA primase
MIDQVTIGRILDRADIIDVISEFITLKKRGVNYLGLCPFHNEKTPSFTVSPAKGIYKCFGCGKGGNVVNFIMEHENLTYPEALKWLARKYHIEVVEKEETEEERQLKDERESLMIVSAYAQKYFTRYLWEEEEGKVVGLSYFRERGIRDDTIRKFELGYCPEGKTPFTDAARKEGYQLEFLEKTGLTIVREEWIRDRFAGRVMFPIRNLAGRIIGFGGRILKDDPKAAKYLNSPESPVYHKSNVLYGLFEAKRELARTDKCYLVEGYTDVLAFFQAGIKNVAASSGTALTSEQIRLIKRFTANITIVYDGDEAGVKASFRGIDMILEEGMNVKVLLLPQGEDPDSFARKKSATELEDFLLSNETDFIRFKTELLLKDTKNDPIAKARLISDLIRSIAVIPDTITRSVYIRECSRLLHVEEEILYGEIRKIKHKKSYSKKRQSFREQQRTPARQPEIVKPQEQDLTIEEKEFLRFLLKYGRQPLGEIHEPPHQKKIIRCGDFMVEEVEKDGLVKDHSLFARFLNEAIKILQEEATDLTKHFIHHPDEQINQLASELLSERHIESKRWHRAGSYAEKEEEILDLLIPKIVNEYKLVHVKEMLRLLEENIKKASETNDEKRISDEQEKYMKLNHVKKELLDKLGNRAFF